MDALSSPIPPDAMRDDPSFGEFHAPLVSVVVINHNYGDYLFSCLSSIERQTYSNIQCVLVDNASTDSTPEALQRAFEHKLFAAEGRSLEVLRYDNNLYQTPAAARALSSARGSYVMFFDADDYMLPECIETHVQAMLSLPLPVGASCSDYYMSSGNDIVTSTVNSEFSRHFVREQRKDRLPSLRVVSLPSTSGHGSLLLNPSDVRYVDQQERGWPWSGIAGFCFRREIVELLLRRVPDLKSQLDTYLIRGVNSLTGSILINRPLVIYRSHGRNIFARGPTLANIYFFNLGATVAADANVAAEVLKTLVHIADELATRMVTQVFVDAIAALLPSSGVKGNTAEDHLNLRYFLKQNEAKLVAAFGPSILESRVSAVNLFNVKGDPGPVPPPVLTFIVVNFNYGRFLEKCVSSIMAQTYANIECIVVDNASSDGSDAILRRLKQRYPYLRVICSPTNLGQIGGCREGFNIASGQFVAFIDADDYLLPEFAERHVAAHITMPNSAGFSSSDMYQEVDGAVVRTSYMAELRHAEENIVAKIAMPSVGDRGMPSQTDVFAVSKECVDWVWSPTSGTVYRSELVRLFIDCKSNANIKTGADAFLNYPINALTGSLVIREPLAVYRVHKSNQFATGVLLSGLKACHQNADPAYHLILSSLKHISANLPMFSAHADTLAPSRAVRTLARKLRRLPSPWVERRLLFLTSIFLSVVIHLSSRKLDRPAYRGRFMMDHVPGSRTVTR